ncbi:hypothetical protein [Cellulophaga omnivescoria]|uniref:hypothetical protein n=1 Tax=Cellulophaga omnivescoria TaxID=1888890 RepID=UPI0011155A33|nr:hypothetical protein [Cellulophaga omnivescoria]
MNYKITLYIVFITMFTVPLHLCSQSSSSKLTKHDEAIYRWFDKQIGLENTLLYNGYLDDGDAYFEKENAYKDSHRYYNQFDFYEGSLIYDNQFFNNINIKYDLFEESLLLTLKNSDNNLRTIRPLNNKVKSFSIDDKYFVNIDFLENNGEVLKGYAELLLNTANFNFYRKHFKQKNEVWSTGKLQYKFSYKSQDFLYYKNEFIRINKSRQLFKIFPEYKKVIKEYSNGKMNNDKNTIVLLKRLNMLMSKKANSL